MDLIFFTGRIRPGEFRIDHPPAIGLQAVANFVEAIANLAEQSIGAIENRYQHAHYANQQRDYFHCKITSQAKLSTATIALIQPSKGSPVRSYKRSERLCITLLKLEPGPERVKFD